MTGSLCSRCGARPVWGVVFPVPRLRDDGGALTVESPTEHLCKECYHAEQRTLAGKWREDRGDHLATLDADALAHLAQELAGAARDASDTEWRTIVAGLREAEQLRGSPWPPEIRRYLLKDARDDRESSA